MDLVIKEKIELEHQIRTIEERQDDMAQLEQDYQVMLDKRRKLDIQKRALEVSLQKIDEISSKIQRDFTPFINKAIEDSIGQITKGRYKKVVVNEDLNVMTEVPETKQIKPIGDLSSGTVDQFYLSLRIALARLIGKDSPLPIILDDSFAQYDDERTQGVLRFLQTVGKENQIIIFSCHKREKSILDKLNIAHNYIDLEKIG